VNNLTPRRKGTGKALSAYLIVVAIELVGATFRFHALTQDIRFHPDEALFSTFARAAAVNGDWLLHGALDKPPLTIYLSAVSMMLFGVHPLPNGVLDLDVHIGEFAARVPGTFGSILLVVVMYRLARSLYPNGQTRFIVPLLAMGLMAVSPFAIAFSATVFTDGLMLLFMMLALMMVARGRWGWSGMFLALGFASKPQALYVIPLLVAVGWALDDRRTWSSRVARLALPTIFIFGLLLIWDVFRDQPGGIWGLAAANNNPGRLIRANEIISRMSACAGYARLLAGPGLVTIVLAFCAVMAFVWRMVYEPRWRTTLIDVVLITYVLAYMLAHWLVAFNTYDRYLLPVLPVALLLMSRGVAWAQDLMPENRMTTTLRIGIAGLCLIAFFLPARDASEGRARVGGDLSKHTGIDGVGVYLNSRDLGAIVYDHWLGWELSYYLGAWSDKRRVYYPTPDTLVAGALSEADTALRYFPVPADEQAGPWLEALRNAGFTVSLAYEVPRFRVYELVRPDN
jgi:4-amino-4-deoxy-L-arabinose transferase-like glycosyltransferase